MIACPSIVLVAWLQSPQSPPQPVPPAAPPAAAPAATKYEFPTTLAPGEPRLIEIRTATSSTIHVDLPGKPIDAKAREESTVRLVDTLLDPAGQPKDHAWSGRRRVVKAQATKDGAIADPEVNGLELDVWLDDQPQPQLHVNCRDDRSVEVETLDGIVGATQSFGLGVGIPLPASAVIGDEFDLLFDALAPTCLTTEGKTPQAVAHLRLEAVDPKKNLARFKGPVHVEEIVEKSAAELDAPFGLKGTGTYDGVVLLEYDVVAHRVARIVCRCKAGLAGETTGVAKVKVSGTNVIETTVTCATGAPAASAAGEKPQFRDVPREIANAGVSITLPSHFSKYATGIENATSFRSLLQGLERYSRVLVLPIEGSEKTVKEAGEAFRAGFENSLRGKGTTKDATASGGLGAASAFEFTQGTEHGLNAIFMVAPNRFVAVQCACPETIWPERSKEWPKYLATLKKLPAAK